MRIFCIAFILYLLLLSWQPCQDLATTAVAPSSIGQTETAQVLDAPVPEESDDCSPFCFCSCCHISTAHARPTFSMTGKFVASSQTAAANFYRSEYSNQHLNSIWQPPKFNFTA